MLQIWKIDRVWAELRRMVDLKKKRVFTWNLWTINIMSAQRYPIQSGGSKEMDKVSGKGRHVVESGPITREVSID